MRPIERKTRRILKRILAPLRRGRGIGHREPSVCGESAKKAVTSFAAGLAFEDIPPPIIEHTKRLLLMGIAWTFLGTRNPNSRSIVQSVAKLGNLSGDCTVIGLDRLASCADAAFLNATHAQLHDCNDGYESFGAYHPGRVLVPTVLAVGEKMHASGKEILCALVAGYEVAARIHLGNPRHRPEGFAAAVVAGKLLRLNADRMAHSMMLSEQHSPRCYPGTENFGADANHISSGLIARIAIESSFQAGEGLTAHEFPPSVRLESGFPASEAVEKYLTTEVYIKPFIACRLCHNAIHLALEFREKRACSTQEIERVDVRLSEGADYVISKMAPDSYFKLAQFSIPYTVSCALLDGRVEAEQFETDRIRGDDVQALQERIFVQWVPEDRSKYPKSSYPTDIKITMKSGEVFSDSRLFPKGCAKNPLADEELTELFARWAGDSHTPSEKLKLAELVFALEDVDDVSSLVGLLRSPKS